MILHAINESNPLYNYEFYPIDFNGDGKTDIMAINNNESFDMGDACIIFDGNSTTELYHSGIPTKWHRIFPGDFNGDGKTDVLTWSTSYGWQITYSNGNGFVFPQVSAPMTRNVDPDASDHDDNYTIGDFNGDGKSDIFEIYTNYQNGEPHGSQINIYYCNGNDFVKESGTFDNLDAFQGYLNFGDFNGDGNQECFYKAFYLDPAIIIGLHPGEKKNFIHSITNGYNLNTAISYEPITNNTIYTKGTGAPIPTVVDFQKSLYVVSSVTTNDGISENNTTNYLYEGAKLHQQGKGFLGFSKLTAENLVDLTKSETSFGFGTPYHNIYPSNVKQYINSIVVSETTNTPDLKTLDGGVRYFPYISTSITEDKVKDIVTEVTTAIDATTCYLTGKITSAKTSAGTIVSQISESYDDFNYFGNPESVTITSTRGSESISRDKTYQYNSKGLLEEQTDFYGSSPSIVKSFTYDDYGNVLTSSVCVGSETRTNTFTYEQPGYRFVKTKTNPINQTISFTNDPVTGNMLEEIDHTGLITEFSYDGFGRKTETRFPDGQSQQNSLGWSLNSHGIGELYYTGSSASHKPSTITYYDYLGRELRSKTQSFNGTYLVTDKTYDSQGRLEKSYMPYYEGSSADQYVEYSYNDIGMLSSETIYPGATITI